MNYAEKDLRETITLLAEARAAENTLQQLSHTLFMGGAVEISFHSRTATATALCPPQLGKELLTELLEKAQERVTHLETLEGYWWREVYLLAERPEDEDNAQRREGADAEQQRTSPPVS